MTYHGTYAYKTDVGRVRSHNEDQAMVVLNSSGEVFLIVCDGMDLLITGDSTTNLYTVQGDNRIYSEDTHSSPQYIGPKAKLTDSLINQGAVVLGEVDHCVVSGETLIEEGASCKNSVIMTFR